MVGNAKVFVLAVAEMVAYLHISTMWPGYSMSVQGDNVRTVVKAELFYPTDQYPCVCGDGADINSIATYIHIVVALQNGCFGRIHDIRKLAQSGCSKKPGCDPVCSSVLHYDLNQLIIRNVFVQDVAFSFRNCFRMQSLGISKIR